MSPAIECNPVAPAWLPAGKAAAIVMTLDDVHPGRSGDLVEAGGDLGAGALRHLERLLSRHPMLRCTLFVTPEWRLGAPIERRDAKRPKPFGWQPAHEPLPDQRFRLSRHPALVAYLEALPRIEIGVHGLHHINPVTGTPIEFQDLSRETCLERIMLAREIFEEAGLGVSPGLCPPAWELSDALVDAAVAAGYRWTASARDLTTGITPGARAAGNGRRDVLLAEPTLLAQGRLVHFTTNFQATSSIDRALAILDQGGLLAVKAHIAKQFGDHVMLDGLDELYTNYLDLLFGELDRRYGEALWWTTMGAIAERVQEPPGAT